MSTLYPNNIDSNLSLPKVIDNVSPIIARDVNQLQEAIIAIETELGINPKGTYSTVDDRLDNILDVIGGPGFINAASVSLADADGYYDSANVEGALQEIGAELADGVGLIGEAEDGTYTDGLFIDFVATTEIGVAVDRFNEILGELAPPPAPALSDMSFTSTLGTASKVSFGTSNAIAGYSDVGTAGGGSALDINGSFTSGSGAALRKGTYAASSTHTGIVADAVIADNGVPTASYPANSFGDGYNGALELEVNGAVVHTLDLTSFVSGTSVNGNGSGFTSVSEGTPVKFPNGTDLNLFHYRTANWTVDPSDQRNGWNYMRVIHDDAPTFTRVTNYYEWVVDANATATTFASESLAAPSMTGSKHISGVEYHTGGTANYGVTVSNLHRNTYSSSGSAVSHPGVSNVSISSASLGTISAESDTEVIASKTATINASRVLDGSLTVDTRIDRTVQSDLTSTGVSQTGILVDNVTDSSADTNEPLNGEKYRTPSNRSLTDTTGLNTGGNGALWDETISLVAATAGYTDGLQLYNDTLIYPVTNFSTVSQGPAGNVDYSSAAGTRTYWRYFYVGGSAQNFNINVSQSGVSFITVATSLGTGNGNAHMELLASNTTVNGGATVEFKDCVVSYTSDTAIGCFASTYGATIPGNWGTTLGTKSSATSGSSIILRVTVGQGWTGSISNISLSVV